MSHGYHQGYYDHNHGSMASSSRFGSNSSMNLGVSGNLKQEDNLAIAIKKALTVEESAPKQKHIRTCILYTWDMNGSGQLWEALKAFPMVIEINQMGNEIIAFKALILYHKVLRQGHGNALKDQTTNPSFLNAIERMIQYQGGSYSELTKEYIKFLRDKLNYHKTHPYFSGTFDYEEYVTLRGVEDPNDGYETITELLSLLANIDRFQSRIFANLRSYGNNEARIAALVDFI